MEVGDERVELITLSSLTSHPGAVANGFGLIAECYQCLLQMTTQARYKKTGK